MKRIGLTDYYINEWHALNYPTFLKNVKDAIDGEFEITVFYAEINHPDLSSDEYEKQYGVHKCSSLEELCNTCDYLMVLYPDNPERKFEVVKKVRTHVSACARTHTHTHTQIVSIIRMKHNRHSPGTGDSRSISRCGTPATSHSLKAAVPSSLLPGSPSSTLPHKGEESG